MEQRTCLQSGIRRCIWLIIIDALTVCKFLYNSFYIYTEVETIMSMSLKKYVYFFLYNKGSRILRLGFTPTKLNRCGDTPSSTAQNSTDAGNTSQVTGNKNNSFINIMN